MLSPWVFSVLLLASPFAANAAALKGPALVTGSVHYNVSAEHKHIFGARLQTVHNKRTCASYNSAAEGTASALQSLYYNTGGWYQGGSGGGSAWTDVNAVEDLINLSLFNSFTTYDPVPEAVLSHYDNQLATSGAYDDALWGALANYKECDYLAFRGESTATCIARAIKYYNVVVSAWDATCAGGVWWSSAKSYKNAITNELFLYVSSAGYLRTGQSVFLSNAQLAWNWLHASGMQNSQGLYNDGLTSSCANNGQTTWTYNQIVVASGLGALYVGTGSTNTALLTAAETSIDATIANMETNGILRESCDNAAGTTTCDADQQIFKGIFMKHLQYYLDTVNDPARTAKYSGFINAQGSAIVHYGTGPGYTVGSVWYAPNAGGSILSPKTQTSGLAGLNAAAKYYSC